MIRKAAYVAAAAVTCLLLFPAGTAAQGQSGSIAGTVRDTTGAVLPGVTVEAASPALIEKVRSVVTDGSGAYKIVDLRPGVYTVTFTLTGFNTVRREGIELTSGFTANINGEMRVGAVEETITVTGEAPTVDVQSVARQTVTSREIMDALPTDRNFVNFAAMTPGMQVTGVLQNVGGSIAETGMNLQIHGSRAGDSQILVDGMRSINGMAAGGLQYGIYQNNAMAQEIAFQTDGMSAEYETSGVQSNFIPKEGSNSLRGFFTGRYTNTSLEADNLDQDLISRGLTSGNKIEKIWDANPSGGGPIIRDRMWIFGAYRHWGANNYIAGLYEDADRSALFYTPSSEQAIYPSWHMSAVSRLTTQVSPKNKVNAYWDYQKSYWGTCFVPSRLTAPSACPEYFSVPGYLLQASWSSPASNKLLLEAGGTFTAQDYQGFRKPGVSTTQYQMTESSTGFVWGSSASYGHNRSDQMNYRASATYVTGSHAAKFGMFLMHTWRYTTQDVNNAVTLTLLNSVPTSLTQYALPIQYHETVNYNMGLYAQDQWKINRFTVNYGLRADFLNAQVDEQNLEAGPFTPARNFAAVKDVPAWRDLSPRAGVAYDVFGTGKTAIKASLGRYVVADSYSIARAVNPEAASINSAGRVWNDSFYPAGDPRRGNFRPDCDLASAAANAECGALNNASFGQVRVLTSYDPALTSGFNVRPYNWEGTLSVQHELVPRVSVYAGYIHRWYGNFFVTQNIAVSSADFDPYCITAPADPRLPDGGGNRQCGFYDVKLAKFGQTNNLVQAADKFGEQQEVYDGFDFTGNARLPRGVMLNGGVSIGRTRTNNCYAVSDLSLAFPATSPRTDAYCDVRPPMQPNVKGQVVYPLPWGVSTAATFQSLPGPQILGQQTTPNAQIAPSLGRNLASCGTAATCNGTVLLDLVAPATIYGERIYQVDLRFSKTIRAGRTVIRPNVSVYNAFNANPVLQLNNRYGSTWQGPTSILTARFVDFGAQIDF